MEPGNLDSLKRSRLKELSSNHVTGFKLRTKSGSGVGTAAVSNVESNYFTTAQNFYSSNKDVVNLLQKPNS